MNEVMEQFAKQNGIDWLPEQEMQEEPEESVIYDWGGEIIYETE